MPEEGSVVSGEENFLSGEINSQVMVLQDVFILANSLWTKTEALFIFIVVKHSISSCIFMISFISLNG